MSSLIWIYSVCHVVFDFFNIKNFILKVFQNFADVILLSAFFALYELSHVNVKVGS